MSDRTHLIYLGVSWATISIVHQIVGGNPVMSAAFLTVAAIAYVASFFASKSA